jgi:hypothetical protein
VCAWGVGGCVGVGGADDTIRYYVMG